MVIQEFGEKIIPPSGTIIMWNEPLSEIPTGWVLCDGNNGTPNMLDRFPRGVNAGKDPGATGGNNSQSLSTSQMPSHSHSGSNTNYGGGHSHPYYVRDYDFDRGYNENQSGAEYGNISGSSSYSTSSNGSHNHSPSLNSTGSGSSIDNRPSFHEVAYIMKS